MLENMEAEIKKAIGLGDTVGWRRVRACDHQNIARDSSIEGYKMPDGMYAQECGDCAAILLREKPDGYNLHVRPATDSFILSYPNGNTYQILRDDPFYDKMVWLLTGVASE